jgi:hypothetical protein
MNSETITCKDCDITFQSSIELEIKTQTCPKCTEKRQDELLRFMFGEPDEKSDDER